MSSPRPPLQVPSRSNEATASRGKSRRHKLPLSAAKILEDYIRMPGFWDTNPTGMPSKSERERLLADIKELPGADFYKMMNLTSWFRYRRPENQRGDSEDARATSTFISTSEGQTCYTRYQSLSTNAITSLSTLCKDTPNPSPETIALWVKFLRHETPGVTLEDVARFLHDKTEAEALKSATDERSHHGDDIILVRRGDVDSGLPTPGNTESPTIVPSRPMWMTPDPFSIKTCHSQSPPLPSVRSTSARTSMSASASVTGSVSPRLQPRTPTKPLNVSRSPMDDMKIDRYTPVTSRSCTPNERPSAVQSRSEVEPVRSPQPQPQSCTSLLPPQVLAQTQDATTDKGLTTAKSSPHTLSALDLTSQDEDAMDISPSLSPTLAAVPLPVVKNAEFSSAASAASGSDSGILQAILQGLASVRDNTVPLAPEVACPTNKTEFDAAFMWFDSTCQMIGKMLETRETPES